MQTLNNALASVASQQLVTTTPTLPAIPDVSSNIAPDLKQFVSSVTQILRTQLGHTPNGSALDRTVTFRDLQSASGMAVSVQNGKPSVSAIGGTNTTTVINAGGGSSGVTGGGTIDYTPPAALTGLVCAGAISSIILTWDTPSATNIAYIEIWRNTSSSLTGAVKIGTSNINVYADYVGEGSSYYYWIRAVSTAAVTGAYNTITGTIGATAIDPSYLLTLLTGQITSGQLASSLSTPIASIPTISSSLATVTTLANSINSAVSNSTTGLAATNALANTLNSLVTNSTTGLSATNTLANTTANTVSNSTTGLSATYTIATGIQSAVNNSTTGLSATNTLANATASSVNNSTTGLSATYSLASSIQSTINNSTTGLSATNTLANTTASAVNNSTTGLSATYTLATSIQSAINNPTTGLSATNTIATAVQSAVNNSTTGLSATYSTLNTLNSAVNNSTTGLSATNTIANAVQSAVSNSTTGLSATYTIASAVQSAINNSTTGLSATNTLANTTASAVNNGSTGLSATYTIATNLQSAVDDSLTGLAATRSQFSSQINTLATEYSTQASQITSINSTLSNAGGTGITLQTALSTMATTLGEYGAKYTVQISNNGVLSGFGLSSDLITGGTPTSQFLVQVNQFGIIAPYTSGTSAPSSPFNGQIWKNTSTSTYNKWNGTAWVGAGTSVMPFAVITTATTINGHLFDPGVYMDGASIVDGTLNGSAIIAGTLTADAISVTNLSSFSSDLGAITAGSININSGVFSVDTLGNMTATNAYVRGNVQATSLSAATGTFSGTLTASAVNAVNTINLAGNSVTVPSSAQTSASVSLTSSAANYLSVTVTTGGGNVSIACSINYEAPSGYPALVAGISRNGTQVGLYSTQYLFSGAVPEVMTFIMEDSPPAGTYTYAIIMHYSNAWAGSFPGTITITSQVLTILETKR